MFRREREAFPFRSLRVLPTALRQRDFVSGPTQKKPQPFACQRQEHRGTSEGIKAEVPAFTGRALPTRQGTRPKISSSESVLHTSKNESF